ncbi:hypothetical protein ACMD2_13113, partial [Ananas comosus]
DSAVIRRPPSRSTNSFIFTICFLSAYKNICVYVYPVGFVAKTTKKKKEEKKKSLHGLIAKSPRHAFYRGPSSPLVSRAGDDRKGKAQKRIN